MDGNGNCNNPQITALQNQMQDNQNANLLMDGIKGISGSIQQLAQNLNCDFNTLNSCCCDLRQAIAQVSGQVGFSAERVINAVNMGDCNVIQAIKDCCCTTQRQLGDLRADIQLQVCQQTGELRNGQRDLGVAISQGFASAAYETQKQTCEIINNQNANTQRIVDTLNSHWRDELQLQNQDLKTKISQLEQTQQILAAIGGFAHVTTAYGNEVFFSISADGAVRKDSNYVKPNEPYSVILEASEIGVILDDVTASQVYSAGEIIVRGSTGPITYTRAVDSTESVVYFTDTRKDGKLAVLSYTTASKTIQA